MKWRASHSAAENAHAVLPRMAKKYFEAGREAAHHKRSPRSLHRFRIATKRFRYSLEIFRPIYGSTLDRYLKGLHELQDALGKVSDAYTVLDMLRSDPALERELESSLKQRSKEFRRAWARFDSPGQWKRWKNYLAGGASRPATVKKKAAP